MTKSYLSFYNKFCMLLNFLPRRLFGKKNRKCQATAGFLHKHMQLKSMAVIAVLLLVLASLSVQVALQALPT